MTSRRPTARWLFLEYSTSLCAVLEAGSISHFLQVCFAVWFFIATGSVTFGQKTDTGFL